MKYAFFSVVLANIILFLWEFQHGAFQPEIDYSGLTANKQILLLSEWRQQEAAKKEAIAAKPETAIDTTDEQPQESEVTVIAEAKIDEPDTEVPELVVPEETAQTERGSLDNEEIVANDDESEVIETEETAVLEESAPKLESTIVSEQQSDVQNKATEQPDVVVADQGKSAESDIPDKDEPEDELKTAEVLDESGATSKSQEDVATEQQAITKVCFVAGPFSDQKQLQQWLISQGIKNQPETFDKEAQVVSSYLVYYPAADTLEESKRNVEMLKNKGIEDYWLFKQGDMKGAISVGLFKEKPRAEKLFRQLLNKGIKVEITERYKTEDQLYVTIRQSIADTANSAVSIAECR